MSKHEPGNLFAIGLCTACSAVTIKQSTYFNVSIQCTNCDLLIPPALWLFGWSAALSEDFLKSVKLLLHMSSRMPTPEPPGAWLSLTNSDLFNIITKITPLLYELDGTKMAAAAKVMKSIKEEEINDK